MPFIHELSFIFLHPITIFMEGYRSGREMEMEGQWVRDSKNTHTKCRVHHLKYRSRLCPFDPLSHAEIDFGEAKERDKATDAAKHDQPAERRDEVVDDEILRLRG